MALDGMASFVIADTASPANRVSSELARRARTCRAAGLVHEIDGVAGLRARRLSQQHYRVSIQRRLLPGRLLPGLLLHDQCWLVASENGVGCAKVVVGVAKLR